MYLLLVDFRSITSEDLQKMIEQAPAGTDIVNCFTTTTLLKVAEKLEPDIIIIDFNLLRGNLSGLFESLREKSGGAYVMALIEAGQYDRLYTAIELGGVDDYMVKPVRREDFLARVHIGGRKKKEAGRVSKQPAWPERAAGRVFDFEREDESKEDSGSDDLFSTTGAFENEYEREFRAADFERKEESAPARRENDYTYRIFRSPFAEEAAPAEPEEAAPDDSLSARQNPDLDGQVPEDMMTRPEDSPEPQEYPETEQGRAAETFEPPQTTLDQDFARAPEPEPAPDFEPEPDLQREDVEAPAAEDDQPVFSFDDFGPEGTGKSFSEPEDAASGKTPDFFAGPAGVTPGPVAGGPGDFFAGDLIEMEEQSTAAPFEPEPESSERQPQPDSARDLHDFDSWLPEPPPPPPNDFFDAPPEEEENLFGGAPEPLRREAEAGPLPAPEEGRYFEDLFSDEQPVPAEEMPTGAPGLAAVEDIFAENAALESQPARAAERSDLPGKTADEFLYGDDMARGEGYNQDLLDEFMADEEKYEERGRRKKKKGSALGRVASVAGNIIFALLLLMMAALSFFLIQSRMAGGVPQVAGYQIYIVLSGSMSPEFDTGSLAFVREIEAEQIAVGDIITFRSRADSDSLTTHRVVEVIDDDGLRFVTRGDANNVNDPSPVLAENVVGRVTGSVPYAGYLMNFVQTRQGLILLIFVPGVLIIVYELGKIMKYLTAGSGDRRTKKSKKYTRLAEE